MTIKPKKITTQQQKIIEELSSLRGAEQNRKIFFTLFRNRASIYDLSFTQARKLISELSRECAE